MDKERINEELNPELRKRVLETLGFSFPQRVSETGWTQKVKGPAELGEGETPRFNVNLSTGAIKDQGSSGWAGDLFSAVEEVMNYTFPEALRWIADEIGVRSEEWNPWQDGEEVESYPYHDEAGNLQYEVVRFELKDSTHPAYPDKTFLQRSPDGKWGRGGRDEVLYRLPDVVQQKDSRKVFIVEGEKDVHTLEKWDLLATCNPQGAGKWRDSFTETLRGADVVILPDNDEAGRKHARKVANALEPVTKAVRIVELPGLPPKGDVTDWARDGHSPLELKELVLEAEPLDASTAEPPPDIEITSMLGEDRPSMTAADIGPKAKRRLRLMRNGKLDLYAKTGFPSLDNMTGGLRRGKLNIFAAVSGAGKTSFLLQVFFQTVRRWVQEGINKTAVFFSAEMSAIDVYTRMACMMAEVNFQELRRREATPQEWARMRDRMDEIMEWPLIINDTQGPSLDLMYNVLRDSGDVGLWGVDYIEKVDVPETGEQALAMAAQGINAIANFWPMAPNLTLSQLTIRSLRSTNDYRPSSSNLRYSQKLFDEASVVLLGHSEKALVKHGIIRMEDGMEPNDDLEVIPAKNRDGDAGSPIFFTFRPQHTLFIDPLVSRDKYDPQYSMGM